MPTLPGDVLADIRHGLRRWRRRPGLAAATILTLALGIGAATAIFAVVDGVLLRPLPYPQSDRIVAIWDTYPHWRGREILDAFWNRIAFSWPDFVALRDHSRSLDAVAIHGSRSAVFSDTDGAREVDGAMVSAGFFDLFGARMALGRGFTEDDDAQDRRVVVLSHAFWTNVLGARPDIVGQTLRFNGTAYAVASVLAPEFTFNGEAVWWPFGILPEDSRSDGNHSYGAYGRLADDVTIEAALADVEPLLRADRDPAQRGARVVPLLEDEVGTSRQPLVLLFVAAGLLLAIACANVAGLLLGDMASRNREMTVRASLGAGRGRLARQAFIEGLLIAAAGCGAGLLVSAAVLPALLAITPASVPRLDEVALDARVLVVATLGGLATVVAFGVGPVLALRRRGTAHALKRGGWSNTGAQTRAQSALVLFEVAVTVVLLSTGGLLTRSVMSLSQVAPGFDPDRLLTMRLSVPGWRYDTTEGAQQVVDRVLETLAALPGVNAVASTTSLAFTNSSSSSSFRIDGQPTEGPSPEGQRRVVSNGFFDAMRVPIERGRSFTEADGPDGQPVAVVSASLAKRYLSDAPIGQRLDWNRRSFTIVGIAGDVKHMGLSAEDQSTFYISSAQAPARSARVVIRTGSDPVSLVAPAREAIQAIDPELVVGDVAAMHTLIGQSMANEWYRAAIVTTFAGAAAMLAIIGLYATMARTVTNRYREIGLRMAIGARPGNVVAMVMRQGGAIVVGGALLGAAASVPAARALRAMLFGVTPLDPIAIAAVAAALVAIGLIATAVPARRAARVDPMVALRHD